jgi:hypothetical protein
VSLSVLHALISIIALVNMAYLHYHWHYKWHYKASK